ncbi:MAG: S49 family peptidase, partial [Natronospirillum sp.]
MFRWTGKILVGLWRTLNFIRSAFFNLLFLFILLVFISAMPGSAPMVIPDGAALVLAPEGILVERRSSVGVLENILDNDAVAEASLPALLDSINTARDDEYIRAIVLNLNRFQGGGFSKLRELGQALLDFRSSGKKVYATADTYNQPQYYLASHADEIMLNPLGTVELQGFGSYQPYFREALDSLNIDMQIFRVGDYKSAVEPYQLEGMSEDARNATRLWLNDLWEQFLADLNQQRGLSVNDIEDYINQPARHLAEYNGNSAELALAESLVD